MSQHFLLSARARTLSPIYADGEDKAHETFCKLRWPETDGAAVYPDCGSLDHYITARKCYACKDCRRQFTVTSGTIFASRKMSFTDLVAAIIEVQTKLMGDPIGFRVSDLEFHRTIMESTGNPFLVRVSHSLYVLGMEYRRIASETPGVLQQSLADHRAIVAAFEARDPDAAEKAMEVHMANVHRSTRDAMGVEK